MYNSARSLKAEENIGIASIQIDPTQLVLACSKSGQIAALTPIEQKQNYIYIELGEETFCTVGLPSARAKDLGEQLADPNPVCCIWLNMIENESTLDSFLKKRKAVSPTLFL